MVGYDAVMNYEVSLHPLLPFLHAEFPNRRLSSFLLYLLVLLLGISFFIENGWTMVYYSYHISSIASLLLSIILRKKYILIL